MTAYAAIIAGFDSSGGAGIGIDDRVVTELGYQSILIQTAFTEQTDQAVLSVKPSSLCELQHDLSMLKTLPLAAVKIGMLVNEAICQCVFSYLHSIIVPIIVDPVLSASSGGLLLEKSAWPFFKNHLLKRATLVTPNIPEAEILLNRTIRSAADIEQAAEQFMAWGVQAVLIKGGHALDQRESADFLLEQSGRRHWFRARRLAVTMRGTGCRLSTAIACYMGDGNSLELAIKKAKKLVYNLIKAL